MLRACLSLLLLAFALAPSVVVAAPPAAPDAPLTYRVHEPTRPTARPPVLVLMHGTGADENDLFDLRMEVPDNFLVISLRAPLPGGNGGYRWYVNRQIPGGFAATDSDLVASRKAVMATLDAILKQYKADESHVFAAGFSQGGVMAYELALMEPTRFLGTAAFSGALFPSQEKRAVPSKALTQLNVFIGHGTADQVIDHGYAVKAKAALEGHRVIVDFHSYPRLAHGINDQELKDFRTWLEKVNGPGQ